MRIAFFSRPGHFLTCCITSLNLASDVTVHIVNRDRHPLTLLYNVPEIRQVTAIDTMVHLYTTAFCHSYQRHYQGGGGACPRPGNVLPRLPTAVSATAGSYPQTRVALRHARRGR